MTLAMVVHSSKLKDHENSCGRGQTFADGVLLCLKEEQNVISSSAKLEDI